MSKQTTYVGPSFFTLLLLLFIGLKLGGVINWSWIWVLSPIWVPIMIILGFVAFCIVMGVITGQYK